MNFEKLCVRLLLGEIWRERYIHRVKHTCKIFFETKIRNMSGWAAVDDDNSNELPEGNDNNINIDGTVQDNEKNVNNNDVENTNNNVMEVEESDEAYQSRLSMNYKAALTDQSKSKPGTDIWENAKELYLETLEDSDPSIDAKAKRLIATAEVSASHGLTILHRLRYLCFKNLGKMYFKENLFANACIQYKNALSVDPRDVMLWYDVAASFAKQSKYVDARYYLERALTISPNHILSLRRLCEILGPDGLDDTIGLKTVYNIMKKHEQQLFEGAAKFYAANDSSIQPFQCVLDGGWNQTNNYYNSSIDAIEESFQKNQDLLLSSDPWVQKRTINEKKNDDDKLSALLEQEKVIVKQTLDDVTFVGLGILLINTFEDIHSKNKQFIGNVVEIETNCQEITDVAEENNHNDTKNSTENGSNNNAIRKANENNLITSASSSTTATNINDVVTNTTTTIITTNSISEVHDDETNEKNNESNSNEKTRINEESSNVIISDEKNSHSITPKNKKREREVDTDNLEVNKVNLPVSSKKQKVATKPPKPIKVGTQSGENDDVRKASTPKRISRRLKSQQEQIQEPVVVIKPKPIARDISESLAYITFNDVKDLETVDFTDDNNNAVTLNVANNILGAHGQYLEFSNKLASPQSVINITSPSKDDEDITNDENSSVKKSSNIAAVGTSEIQKLEQNHVLKFVDELNSLQVDIAILLQHYCRSLCYISNLKLAYKVSSSLQHVQSTQAQMRKLKLNSISDIIVKSFSLLTKFHRPLTFITLDTHTSADGLNERKSTMTTKTRQKILTKMKNLRHETINNICIGGGIETDALAWLTAAEIEIDQATKQKLNIYGGGSSEFYKRKATRNVKSSKRCLKEMWITLAKYAMENTVSGVVTPPSRMKNFLEQNKRRLSQLGPEIRKNILERIRNGETYLKHLWEGRLRYYWLCAQLDNLNEKRAQSLFMLNCCAVTLNEKHVLEERIDFFDQSHSNQQKKAESGEIYYLNHCIHSNTIDHAGIVRRLDELASKSTIDKAIAFYKEAVDPESTKSTEDEATETAPIANMMEATAEATSGTLPTTENVMNVDVDNVIDLANKENDVPMISEEEMRKKRIDLFKNAIDELRNRYLPSTDSIDFDDHSWTCHYSELIEDFFHHQDDNSGKKNGKKNKKNSSSNKRNRTGDKKRNGNDSKKRKRDLRLQDLDEDAEIRPDLISIIVESCVETDNLLLASKFVGRIMSELATPGRILDTAIENVIFLKHHGLDISSNPHPVGSKNRRANMTINVNDSGNNNKSESPFIIKKRQVIARTRVFCLHIINSMSTIASAHDDENKTGATSTASLCWSIFKKVLPSYVHLAILLNDKKTYTHVIETAKKFQDESFTLAFVWKLSKMYFDKLYHGIATFEKQNPKNGSIISQNSSSLVTNSTKTTTNRLTYKHAYEKYIQSDLLEEHLDHFDRELVDMLQISIEMAVECVRARIFKQTAEIKVAADSTLNNDTHRKIFSGFLFLALDILKVAKRITSLRFFSFNLYFTFLCALVPVSFHVEAEDEFENEIDEHELMDKRHDCLRGAIESVHLQLGKWGLTTAHDGQLLKYFVHVLTVMDKWNAYKGEQATDEVLEVEDGDTDDEDEDSIDPAKFTIELLGKVYYDLFGFNIDPAFKTDDDYPPRGKYLSLRDKTLSNNEQAKRKQFCIDLFDFSSERIQSKTSGVPSKDKRFMLFELYKVFQIDVWQYAMSSTNTEGENNAIQIATDNIMSTNEIPYGKLVINILQSKSKNINRDANNDGSNGTTMMMSINVDDAVPETDQPHLKDRVATFIKEIKAMESNVNAIKLESGEKLVRNEFYRLYIDLMQEPGNANNSNEKNQEMYNFHRVRIEVLLQDLSYNPNRIESWYDLGMSASILLNNRIDATLDLARNTMTKLKSNTVNDKSNNLQTTLDAFVEDKFDYYFVNRIKLHTIALNAFEVAAALSKRSQALLPIPLVQMYEQIGMITYNDVRFTSRKQLSSSPTFESDANKAFDAFEKANKEVERWDYNLYMGKIALKLDRDHIVDETSNNKSLRKMLRRGLKYLRKAYDLRIVKSYERPIEYTMYRLHTTIIKGILDSHKLNDEDVMGLLENITPDYPGFKQGKKSSLQSIIDKNIYLRRYKLLSFCIDKIKSLIKRSVSISDHRSRFMVARALYHGDTYFIRPS